MNIERIDPHSTGPNIDTDVYIGIDRADVDSLNNDVTRGTIAAYIIANVPGVGPVIAVAVNERINQVVSQSGPNGCQLEVTVRNGLELKVFTVHPR